MMIHFYDSSFVFYSFIINSFGSIRSIQIITKFLQHFVAVAICVLKLEINILKHLAIHGMTTASRVL